MIIVPIRPIPNQTLQVQVATQPCVLNIYQTLYGLMVDVYLGARLIAGGVLAENLNRIVRYAYLGFDGDFVFGDTQGEDDPIYTGLGDRFQLVYLTGDELAAVEA